MATYLHVPQAVHRKRRGRGGSRVFTRFVLILAVAVTAYVALAAWLWMRQPTIAFDPVKRLQDLTPQVPADQAAWPKYRKALAWYRQASQSFGTGPAAAEQFTAAMNAVPGGPAWPDAVAMLRGQDAGIAALREASKAPTLGYLPRLGYSPEDAEYLGVAQEDADEPTPEFPAFSVLFPQLGELRNASRLLRLDALIAAQNKDGARVAEDIAAMVRVARHTAQTPVMIACLVRNAILASAATTAVEAVELNPSAFRSADLSALEAALASITTQDTLMLMESERIARDDVLQRIFTDGGGGHGSALPAGFLRVEAFMQPLVNGQEPPAPPSSLLAFLAGPLTWARSADRADVSKLWGECLDETEAQSALPAYKQSFPKDGALQGMFQPNSVEARCYFPMPLLTPAIAHSATAASQQRDVIAAARTRVVVERFKRDQGRWPDTLQALVPKYLPGIPTDEFNGQPLEYSVANGKPSVRSARPER